MSRRPKTTGKPRRRAKKTVLLVGEGHSECAFLHYLKSQYAPRHSGVAVTIYNARGKGPRNVIDCAIRQDRGRFDLHAALLDSDLECPPTYLKKARASKVHLIWSNPCFEGLLLYILERHVPQRSELSKTAFDSEFAIDRYQSTAYTDLFPKSMLEKRRPIVSSLDALCRLLEGREPANSPP